MTVKTVYLAFRDSKGRMHSVNPAEIPADAPAEVREAASQMLAALALVKPKGKRGRPAGYKCSPETVAQMVASRRATLEAQGRTH